MYIVYRPWTIMFNVLTPTVMTLLQDWCYCTSLNMSHKYIYSNALNTMQVQK